MSLAMIAAILFVAPRVLAVSIHDEVLPWLRDAWAAFAPPNFPHATAASWLPMRGRMRGATSIR
eukprot:811079-Prymnesium_polylepis.1